MKTESFPLKPPTDLHKKVDEAKNGDDDGHRWCSNQDDDTSSHDVEHGAHEHFNDAGDHCVYGVYLLGKAVDKVPTGCSLEEGHG